ncbi:hypothetical protein D3C81_1371500 [compost metagenome]
MGLFDKFKRKKEMDLREVNSKENKEIASPVAQEERPGPVLGFVLLDRPQYDWNSFIETMARDWDIEISEATHGENLVFVVGEMMVACAYMPVPIPEREVEDCCKYNLIWPEAEQVVSAQQAHVIVTVMNTADPLAAHVLFTQVTASLSKWEHAIAFYSAPLVVSADNYIRGSEVFKEDDLPIQLWVFIGLYTQDQKVCAYTVGLNKFGKDEIEILKSEEGFSEVFEFMHAIISYVIGYHVTLMDGQTIGFTAEQKLPLTRSKGVSVEGDSIKIGF